jgi:hypothetical protein
MYAAMYFIELGQTAPIRSEIDSDMCVLSAGDCSITIPLKGSSGLRLPQAFEFLERGD